MNRVSIFDIDKTEYAKPLGKCSKCFDNLYHPQEVQYGLCSECEYRYECNMPDKPIVYHFETEPPKPLSWK